MTRQRPSYSIDTFCKHAVWSLQAFLHSDWFKFPWHLQVEQTSPYMLEALWGPRLLPRAVPFAGEDQCAPAKFVSFGVRKKKELGHHANHKNPLLQKSFFFWKAKRDKLCSFLGRERQREERSRLDWRQLTSWTSCVQMNSREPKQFLADQWMRLIRIPRRMSVELAILASFPINEQLVSFRNIHRERQQILPKISPHRPLF